MSTTTETISIAELEEMFTDDVPCGGNLTPQKRPCPDSAPAVYVSSHICPMGGHPEQFKCAECYRVWKLNAKSTEKVACSRCGWKCYTLQLYRRL